MITLTRLTPVGHVFTCLFVVAVLANLLLKALDQTPVLAWIPETVTGTGYFEEARGRVAQAAEEYRLGRVATDEHLAAVVGISNVRESIQLSVLRDGSGGQWRFLGLGGAGFGMGAISSYADLLLSSDLRPEVVLIGFGLHQLADSRGAPRSPAPVAGPLSNLMRGNIREAAIQVRQSTWMYARRRDVQVAVESAALDLRARLFTLFGVSLAHGEARRRGPWREMTAGDWPDHFSAATLQAQEDDYARRGIFDLDTYERSPESVATLVRIIREFRDRGATVVLVLLPEHSRLNKRIPAPALDLLHQRLGAEFPDDAPTLLDFRQALDDSSMVDLPHPNRQGRLEFSRKLAAALRPLLIPGRTQIAERSVAAAARGER